ncbi:MAG TPA: methylmalonyl-CoA epimerase [Thermodesulfobacteriota bacterium]|nr:methylmalonyl-CoA epimerase [Thermodesulfobacteriota bacterium]
MIRKIAHIGIAVKNIEEAEKFYTGVLGFKVHDRENLKEIKASFIPIGDTAVELLQSTTPEGVINRFIEKRGEGVQHIAYQVDNIEEALEELKAKGIPLIDEKPRKGAHNSKVAFVNPKGTYGVLVELVEPEKH